MMRPATERATAGTVTLIPNRPGRRININPLEVTVITNITPAASRATGSSREEADEYRGFIVQLNDEWRVVECRGAIQWILQRSRAGIERVGGRWASVSYHRSRTTLIAAVTRRCGDVDPDRAELIDQLPAMIGGAA